MRTNRMSAKLAFMMATGIHLGRRDEPKPQPKTLYLARFQMSLLVSRLC